MLYEAENIQSSYLVLSAEKPLHLIDHQLNVAVSLFLFAKKSPKNLLLTLCW